MEPMINWVKKFGRWIIRIFKWLWEAKKVWLTLLSIVGVLLFWYMYIGNWEDRFRFTGLTLEILGIGTVVHGLNETLKLFERTHPISIISAWFKRFPKFEDKNNDITISLNGNFINTSLDSALSLTSYSAPNISLDRRVALLEESLNQTKSQIFVIQQMLKRENQNMSEALTNESHEREIGDEKAQQKLKEFAIDGLAIEMMGVVWLVFGAIFATLSKELVEWFN